MKKAGICISYKWKAMAVGALGVLVSTMDEGMIRIALPGLGEVFGVGPNSVIWVQLIYLMVGTGMMLTIGKVADIFGRKKVFTLGLVVSSLGLVLCSLSQNFSQLLLARFVFSVGATMSIATANAIVAAAFPARERGRALGIIGVVISIGLLSGPAVGGVLLDTLGWRSIFFLRLPFSILGALMAFLLLKKESLLEHKGRFDITGAGILLLAIPALLLVLNRGQSFGWTSPMVLILASGSLLLLCLFIVVERRAVQPVLELKLFSNRLFSAASGSHILIYMSTAAIDFTMPFYLIQSLSLPTSEAGLLLVTIPAVRLVVSPLSGRLSDRWGSNLLCGSGLVLIVAGMLLLRRLSIDTPVTEIVPVLVVVGLGMGLFVIPNTSAIMGAVSQERLGTASAMVGLLRQLGMSTGLAIAGSLFASGSLSHAVELASRGLSAETVLGLSMVNGMQDTLLIALIFAVIGFIVSTLRGRSG
jgi:EmrB/QacA subfamily drug resistance transporter